MEEEKSTTYYNELTRKGEGATRFKKGLGFSSIFRNSNDTVPARGSALVSSSSFLNSFVRASSPSKITEFIKQGQIQTIKNKIKNKPKYYDNSLSSRVSNGKNSRSPSPSREKHLSRKRESLSQNLNSRSRNLFFSPTEVKEYITARSNTGKDRTAMVDYRRLIEGYEKMTPAERVKAKMKLQLSESARKEETNSMGSGWERFDFDKDAPLDDEEIEAVEDDGALVNHTGKSFRFSAVATRRGEKIKAAHDEAIFGAPSLLLLPPSTETDDEAEEDNCKEDISKVAPAISLISGQALAMQQGSWRDRARRS
ncbi:hypothetical protein P3L10_030844 [Capsicum annuum]|uniref:uncharacterized protein LOC107871930 n=1 Tax=Capsicum annuum TaxID=4072 RepID=UPI001FB0B595|nr:uncharacterized protein LOC107871930 [Capsicum annuum]